MDIHYTPSALATSLVQATSEVRPKLVADLAAGNGNLLLAAEQVWPNARFVATDIDPRAVRRLGRLRPSWTVGRCDLRSVPVPPLLPRPEKYAQVGLPLTSESAVQLPRWNPIGCGSFS